MYIKADILNCRVKSDRSADLKKEYISITVLLANDKLVTYQNVKI
jgi:hypothetical protein